jgi:hypothetical protein
VLSLVLRTIRWHESMHGTDQGPSDSERPRCLSGVWRLWFLLTSVLLPAGFPAGSQRRRRHREHRRGWVVEQP